MSGDRVSLIVDYLYEFEAKDSLESLVFVVLKFALIKPWNGTTPVKLWPKLWLRFFTASLEARVRTSIYACYSTLMLLFY